MHFALLFAVSLVNQVRELIAHHELAAAEQTVRAAQMRGGSASEVAASVSWLARAALEARDPERADQYASEARKLTLANLHGRPLDADPWLPTALGASIEVHAQVLAGRGERAEAVSFLRQEIAAYGSTSIGERIRKDLNLLSLTGKPAPAIEFTEWVGARPRPLSELRGHPVLLFFWAHWCADCKGDVPILASVMKTYGPRGLALEAPTRYYGYAAGGEDATPAAEKQYIEQVRSRFYAGLEPMPAPISGSGFLAYGASTTPTIVLVDRAGIVRYYHPGAVSEAELAAQVEKVMAR